MVNLFSMLVLTISAVLLATWLMLFLTGALGYLEAYGFDFQLIAWSMIGVAFAGASGTLFFSRYYVFHILRARIIDSPQTHLEKWLSVTVASQARTLGIRCPDIAVFDTAELNAFTTGSGPRQAMIVVSQGLLQGLHQDELEAVLAHEISHIANGDMRALALSQGVVNSFVVLPALLPGYLIDKTLLRQPRPQGLTSALATWLLQLCFGWLASLLVMWFSRYREYRADRSGAMLVGFHKMRSALQCLYAMRAASLPRPLAAFGISGRLGRGVRRLFMSHPSLGERLAALRQLD